MHAIAFFEKMDRYHAAESLQGYNCSELGQGPPPPLIWTKAKRTAAIFRDVFPYTGTNREMKFVKCFTPVRFLKLSNLPEKTRKLRHLMKKIENVRCFIYLCANFYSITKSLQSFCEKSCLNLANFKEAALFLENFTRAQNNLHKCLCAIYDKYHVCTNHNPVLLRIAWKSGSLVGSLVNGFSKQKWCW